MNTKAARLDAEIARLCDLGRYAEAIPVARRLRELIGRQAGESHSDYAAILNRLAELHRLTGDYIVAEPLYAGAIAAARAALGGDHPDVARYMNDLGLLYRAMGKDAAAESFTRSAAEILLGARVEEDADRPDSPAPLAVGLFVPPGFEAHASSLTLLLQSSAWLRIAGPGEKPEVRACLVAPRDAAGRDDPLPYLQRVVEPCWAVVGPDGLPLMPIHAASEPRVASLLCDNLEVLARYRWALAIHNPDPLSALRNRIRFTLFRHSERMGWSEAVPAARSSEVVFEDGDRIAFEIANVSAHDVFITVLDFGLTGRVFQLHPQEGVIESLPAGGSTGVGFGRDTIELFIPEHYPFIRDPAARVPVEGREVLKMFASIFPVDFTQVLQDWVRGSPGEAGPGIGKLLRGAAPDEDWTTVERAFVLREASRPMRPQASAG